MKVLQLLPSLDIGGVERGVIDLVRALKKRGDESVVISSGGPLVTELQKMGISHYKLPVHKKSIFSLSLVPQIADLIRKERIDIVHARSRVPAWIAWFAARRAGVPFVTTCHGYYSNHFLSRIMGWGKRVIVISRVIGRHMMDDFGVAPERLRLIHRGVDVTQFTFKKKYRNVSEPFRIINIGRFSPIKGQVEFLHSIYRLRKIHPHIEVSLVGAEGKGKLKYTALIQRTIEQLDLKSCVKLLGTRRDIPELLEKADLLVLPTLVPEAFGRVIVEAGAVGVPVIATGIGGVLDIIDHGQNGLLVNPGDIEGLTDAVRHIIEHPERAASFSESLYQKVHREFLLDSMVEKTLAVYREVKDEKQILVIKLGAMGDLILSTPSLRMIRKRFPKSKIVLLVDKKWASVLSACPYVDQLILANREKLSKIGYLLKIAKKLRTIGFDCSVDLQNSKWTHLLALLAGIPERFGFSRGALGFLLNRPDRSFAASAPPVEHQFRILSKLGVREMEDHLELWPDLQAENKIAFVLEELKADPDRKKVGFVLGSSPLWPSKRWPLEYYEALALKITKELGAQVVLIGSKEDAQYAAGYFEESAEAILNFMGKTNTVELLALIKKIDVLVTGDTAPLHIAAALHKKIVALFGPTDSRRHMPPAAGASVLSKSLECQPCYQGHCKNTEDRACLRHISVREVFESVKRQLQAIAQKPQPMKIPFLKG